MFARLHFLLPSLFALVFLATWEEPASACSGRRRVLSPSFRVGWSQAAEKPAADDTIKELLKKRRDTLTQLYDVVFAGYQRGQFGYDQVLDARTAVLNAELDLCETKEQRLQIHEKLVKVAESVRTK